VRLLLAILLVGCAAQGEVVKKSTVDPPRVRLGWVSWNSNDEIYACTRRVDDNGNTIGVMGPCKKIGLDGVNHTLVSWLNVETPDRSPSNASPFPAGCKLVLEDGHLPSPARLILVTPTGRKTLDEWKPDEKTEGDVFATEATFSSDGKRMASVHLAIGLGEGERVVAVAGAKLFDTPACE
jgi:hypothetical protein